MTDYVIYVDVFFVELVGAAVAEPHELIEIMAETRPFYDQSDRVGEALR